MRVAVVAQPGIIASLVTAFSLDASESLDACEQRPGDTGGGEGMRGTGNLAAGQRWHVGIAV